MDSVVSQGVQNLETRYQLAVALSDAVTTAAPLTAHSLSASIVESLGVYSHFCDTRESPPVYGVLVFGKPFLLYHRSGHFPQPC